MKLSDIEAKALRDGYGEETLKEFPSPREPKRPRPVGLVEETAKVDEDVIAEAPVQEEKPKRKFRRKTKKKKNDPGSDK